MTLRSSLLFAYKILFPKTEKKSSARKSLFGAIVCIAISLVPLVVVLSVSDGMISGMTERIIGLSTSHLAAYLVNGANEGKDADSFADFAKLLGEVEGVTMTYPEIATTALAASGSYRTGAQVRAVPPELFGASSSGDVFASGEASASGSHFASAGGAASASGSHFASAGGSAKSAFSSLLEVKSGNVDAFVSGSKTAIIGTRLAELLDLSEGSSFMLITMVENAVGTMSVKYLRLTVAAIVSSGYQELDALWVFIPLDTAFSSNLPLNNADFVVHIETEDAFSPELARIERDLNHIARAKASIYSWDELNAAQFENFSSTRVMLVFIMTLIVLVASVNISAALVMLVMERRREIAILKSIGASSRGIMFSFVVVGFAAGIGGVLIGLPLGIACAINCNQIISFVERLINLCAEIFYALRGADVAGMSHIQLFNPEYYLTEISANVSFSGLFIIAAVTLFLSLAVSVIPAYRAGKERPLETLRKM